MTAEHQTWAAAGIVFLTAAVFLYRIVSGRKSRPGCGGGCDCSGPRRPQ